MSPCRALCLFTALSLPVVNMQSYYLFVRYSFLRGYLKHILSCKYKIKDYETLICSQRSNGLVPLSSESVSEQHDIEREISLKNIGKPFS